MTRAQERISGETVILHHQQQQEQQQQEQHQEESPMGVPLNTATKTPSTATTTTIMDHENQNAHVRESYTCCSWNFSRSERFQSIYRDHCIYLFPMLGWFLFSGLLSLYNKYIFGDTHMAFPCPLLMTSVHFATQFLFSYILTKRFPVSLGGDQVESMSWSTFLSVAVPCGLVTSFDVGLSNLALVRITMTFYTMVKSSSPIFVVASAYCFGIEKITWSLILTVFIISTGELLTVMGEVAFDLIGFILVLSASILSGMRWTVVQLKLQSLEPRLKSTIAVMRILSPFMFLSMLFLSMVLEKPWVLFGHKSGSESGISFFDTPRDALWTLGLGMIGAVLAICMIICEFYLIMKSSAVVLMIGGVLKELTTIMIGVTVMGDQLNTVNSLGCVVVFSGVLLYKISHHLEHKEKVYDSLDMDSAGSISVLLEEDSSPLGHERRLSRGTGDDHDLADQVTMMEATISIGDRSGAEANAYGTINKRRRAARSTSLDQETSQRPLVESKDAELT